MKKIINPIPITYRVSSVVQGRDPATEPCSNGRGFIESHVRKDKIRARECAIEKQDGSHAFIVGSDATGRDAKSPKAQV